MRTLDQLEGPLLWRGGGWTWSRSYDLVRADEGEGETEPYATLRWREGFIVGRSPGELEAAGGAWRFVPQGLFGRRVLVETLAGAPVAAFGRHLRGGVLRLEDGRALRWRRHWFRRTWTFEDENGYEVVRLVSRFRWIGVRVTVEIASTVPSELRALVAGFGFYLVRRAQAAARRSV